MRGLMQDVPLTVDRIIDHAAMWHGNREIVSRDAGGAVSRSNYRDVHALAKQVSNALARDGIAAGDRVATLAWNSARHIASWYGVAGMGAVLHTLNPRLFLEQIAYIANHAGGPHPARRPRLRRSDRAASAAMPGDRARDLLLRRRRYARDRIQGDRVRRLDRGAGRPNTPGAASTRTSPAGYATLRAPPGTRRACSIRTARTGSTC